MTAITEHEEHQQHPPDTAEPTPRRASSNTTAAKGRHPFERMGEGKDLHPAFLHPWLATGWVGASGVLIDAADPSTLALSGITAGAGFLGTMVGSATVDAPGEEHERYMVEAGALGGVTGLGAGAWAFCAQAADLVHNLAQPGMWGGLVAGGVAWAGWYVSLRLRLNRVRNPESPAKTKALRKALGGVYETIMREAGFGEVTVVEIVKGFNGASERVLIDLDDNRHETNKTVVTRADKIAGVARSIFKTKRAVRLPNDAVSVSPDANDAGRVILDIQFRDVLNESIDPSEGGDFLTPVYDPAEPMRIGLWQHGEPIDVPESGPHGIGVGSTGTGKSTYSRGLVIHWMRRPHVAIGLIGLSKFFNMAKQFTQPAADGTATRPVFALMAGGDGQSEEEIDSAVKGLMTLYTLMQDRMQNPDLPRDGDGNMIPSKQHPRFITYMDEIDVLIKRTSDGRNPTYFQLPNGNKVNVPEMLNEIASKGRSEGVELEVSSQRVTDTHMGGAWAFRDFLTNTHRRIIFWTPAQSDAQALSDKVNSNKIQKHTMRMAIASNQVPVPGKVFHYKENHVLQAIQAMEGNDTFGTLSGAEAEKLGSLWSERWLRARKIQQYFKSLGAEIDAEVAAGGSEPSLAQLSSDSEQRSDRKSAPPIGMKNNRLQDAIDRAHREAENNQNADSSNKDMTSSQRDFWESALSDIEAMTQPPQNMPARKVLRQVIDIFAELGTEDATPGELLNKLGWTVNGTQDPNYNDMSGVLKSKLQTATGNDELKTRQSRRREGRPRVWFRSDLVGGEQQ